MVDNGWRGGSRRSLKVERFDFLSFGRRFGGLRF